jgi:hypothetical protein
LFEVLGFFCLPCDIELMQDFVEEQLLSFVPEHEVQSLEFPVSSPIINAHFLCVS